MAALSDSSHSKRISLRHQPSPSASKKSLITTHARTHTHTHTHTDWLPGLITILLLGFNDHSRQNYPVTVALRAHTCSACRHADGNWDESVRPSPPLLLCAPTGPVVKANTHSGQRLWCHSLRALPRVTAVMISNIDMLSFSVTPCQSNDSIDMFLKHQFKGLLLHAKLSLLTCASHPMNAAGNDVIWWIWPFYGFIDRLAEDMTGNRGRERGSVTQQRPGVETGSAAEPPHMGRARYQLS